MFSELDRAFMQEAIELAKEAELNGEVPVGAVITLDNKIIGRGFNQVISLTDVTAHAEILAIKDASKTINNYRLKNTCMYVTLEPCHMCAKALIDARVSKLIFSTFEPKSGAITSIDNLYEKPFNHNIEYQHGLLQAESSKILKEFFKARRN
ncbi:tRNA adenosine(34) deaminase TadA [Gammaproteobacteria bacterium]|nr:tRNA adenosine(34) deaminase TadA [Gammaproteobacteria bacterium]